MNQQCCQKADDKGKSFTNEETPDVEHVVVIVIHHVLRTLEDEIRIMAEPDDVQNDGIVEVYDRPQYETVDEGISERRALVNVT